MCSSSGNSPASPALSPHLVNTVQELSARGVGLRVLTGQGAQIDTTTAGAGPAASAAPPAATAVVAFAASILTAPRSRRPETALAFAAALAAGDGNAQPRFFATCLSGSLLPYVVRQVVRVSRSTAWCGDPGRGATLGRCRQCRVREDPVTGFERAYELLASSLPTFPWPMVIADWQGHSFHLGGDRPHWCGKPLRIRFNNTIDRHGSCGEAGSDVTRGDADCRDAFTDPVRCPCWVRHTRLRAGRVRGTLHHLHRRAADGHAWFPHLHRRAADGHASYPPTRPPDPL